MKKTVLFAGKEYPAGSDFVAAAVSCGRNAVVTVPAAARAEAESGEFSKPGVRPAVWNKSSSVSARSVVLQAENAFRSVEEAVLLFDTAWFAPEFQKIGPETCSRALDAMIAGYVYLSAEIIGRYVKKGGGTLVFALKEHPSFADLARTGALRSEAALIPAGILCATAAGAFAALAENTAAGYADSDTVRILLARSERGVSDAAFAEWLFPYLDAWIASKPKSDAKRAAQWVKFGAKPPAGFTLFRK
ncbi:hypothetical protein [Treponema brennaborense]|uniref:Uncharacterized protein n=1 Tax=Treponema brennaborense (strain DSM 12168 / CIP 105900 / DD5/3) TaxID=906968 RepID=F4LMJ8_TREBD|nr:hypothetical protein [Treponema brennaborense]AEE15760.1 hypothetical protein Trebr_0313 [Treponema brennaborense DSM 12168]